MRADRQSALDRADTVFVKRRALARYRRQTVDLGLAVRERRHFEEGHGHVASKRHLEEFLAKRSCRVAPATIYTEDYMLAAAYDRATRRGGPRP